VSAEYFDVLGLRAAAGRLFAAADDRAGAPPVVVLGHGLWRRRFGGDPSIVGREVALDGAPHTVVGVLQAHPRVRDEVFAPLALTAQEIAATGTRAYTTIGLLRADATLAAAQAELAEIAARLAAARPHSNTGVGVELVPIREQIVGGGSAPALMLLGAAGFVLLIACVNVANLLLARAATRAREVAVRTALGATRGRVVRQVLTETVLLGALGGGLGTLLAIVGLDALVAVLPATIPRLEEVSIDGVVLGFAAAASLLVGVAFGLAPAFGVVRRPGELRPGELQSSGRGTASVERRRTRDLLVAAEVACAAVLLTGAGLMARSLWALHRVEPGADTGRTLVARLALPAARYPDAARIVATYDRILDGLAAIPGVVSAAAANNVPLSGEGFQISFAVAGRPAPAPDRVPTTLHQIVSADYFRTLGVPVVEGRAFAATDRADAPRVGIVNETMARRAWPDGGALGARVTLDDGVEEPLEVVGVVADVRHHGPARAPEPELYVPHAQAPPIAWRWQEGGMSLLVRADAAPAAVLPRARAAVAAVDRELPVFGLTTLEQVVDDSVASTRALMRLLVAFAGLALILAAVGVYGVVSYGVAQRTRELGIRVALGAAASSVRRLVLGRGMAVAGLGIALGTAASVVLARTLRASLYGVGPTDPATLAGVAAILAAVSAAACWLPARRAARLDPVVALKTE
jgi:predicted permease